MELTSKIIIRNHESSWIDAFLMIFSFLSLLLFLYSMFFYILFYQPNVADFLLLEFCKNRWVTVSVLHGFLWKWRKHRRTSEGSDLRSTTFHFRYFKFQRNYQVHWRTRTVKGEHQLNSGHLCRSLHKVRCTLYSEMFLARSRSDTAENEPPKI